MVISLNAQPVPFNSDNLALGVKTAQLAKQQQQAEGQIALDLIAAATPEGQSTPTAPEGNVGNNVDTTA